LVVGLVIQLYGTFHFKPLVLYSNAEERRTQRFIKIVAWGDPWGSSRSDSVGM